MYRIWRRIVKFSGPQPVEGRPFIGEGVPLALDAGVVRVEGLADADHIQAGLVCQLLHQGCDLLHRLAVDLLLAHGPVNWPRDVGSECPRPGRKLHKNHPAGKPGPRPPAPARAAPLTVLGHYSGHRTRPRVHVHDDPWVASGEVGHFAFHELPARPSEGEYGAPDPVPSVPAPHPTPVPPLPRPSPGAAGRGSIPAEAEAQALQLLHVATQPVMEDARQEAARSPARGHGYGLAAQDRERREGGTHQRLPAPGSWAAGRVLLPRWRRVARGRVTHVAGRRVAARVATRSRGSGAWSSRRGG